ncbi:MAG: antibiotic biosynthesis monooxygenase [Pseudomonadales bacterium]
MIVVNAVIESTADNIADMAGAIAAMEAASRLEAGCHDYTFSVELNNQNVLRITEKWESMAALVEHFGQPHMVAFQATMAAYPPKSVSAAFYDAKEVAVPGR